MTVKIEAGDIMAKTDLSKGCPHCGCSQYEKDMFHFARPKNLVLCVCTVGVWYVWLILKSTFKGSPYRCVGCKKYLPW